MTLATRGMGSPNLIPTAGLGNYGSEYVPPPERTFKGGNSSAKKDIFELITKKLDSNIGSQDFRVNPQEITSKELLSLIDKKALSLTIKEIERESGLKARESRKLLTQRVEKQISAMKDNRINDLNQETIAMMMIAIIADE